MDRRLLKTDHMDIKYIYIYSEIHKSSFFLLRFDDIKPNLFKSVEKTKSTALHFNVAAHMAFLEAVCVEQVQALN